VLQRLALATPAVVRCDARRQASLRRRSGHGRARAHPAHVGADLADSLVEVDAIDGDVRLSGFAAPPRFRLRGDTGRQMWFLNGRPVRDKVLCARCRDGYKGFCSTADNPSRSCRCRLDPGGARRQRASSKTEVRFRTSGACWVHREHAARRGEADGHGDAPCAARRQRAAS